MMMTTEPVRKKRYVCKAAKEIDLKVLKIQFAGFITPLNKQILDPQAFQGEERDFSQEMKAKQLQNDDESKKELAMFVMGTQELEDSFEVEMDQIELGLTSEQELHQFVQLLTEPV